MLKIKNLNQYYGQSHTLRDVNLHLKTGEITCILGRNGVGKSTLAKSLMGLLELKSGEILFENQDLKNQSPTRRAELGIAYVPQGREIFSQLSVKENLQTGLFANRFKRKKIDEKIYELFPVLAKMQKRKGGDLSGGQQQQLAIARALCLEPKLLILDEPSEGIQPDIVQYIGEVISKLKNEDKISIFLIEQKLPFARKFGDSFYILDRGSVVANGQMNDLNDELIAKYLSV